MADQWTYASWITVSDSTTRLAQLRLHIQEVTQKIHSAGGVDGTNLNPTNLNEYLSGLMAREQELGRQVGGRTGSRGRVRGF